jgi:ligand-binding SRPBCC domain-containing protein
MPTIDFTTEIAAPRERVFDLSRSIDLHSASLSRSKEQAIAGVTSGLIGLGQEVTWRARHFGVWFKLRVRISEMERPARFADVMVDGPFRRVEHHHYFAETPAGTEMRDVFSFASPFGIIGRIVDALCLQRYMHALLIERNRAIKAVAESDEWKRYLHE